MEIIDDTEHLTVKEVSRLLNVSTRTIFTHIKKGTLKTKKIGNKTFINHNELNKIKPRMKEVSETSQSASLPEYTFNPETHIVLGKEKYEGLIYKVGVLEERCRVLETENQKLLEYKPEKKRSWWKRMFTK
jgi:excisionase family DNA binding protein